MDQSSIDLLEKTIIGCLYTKSSLVNEVFVKEEYFTNSYNRLIFKISLEFFNKNNNLDLILIYQQYQKYVKENFVLYIHDCTNLIATTTIFNEYQNKLFEIYKNRLIINYVKKFINQELNQTELFDNLEKVKNMSSNVSEKYLTEDKIINIINQKNKQINLKFKALNSLIELKEKDFIVIGARPGVGKTGFALNLLEDISNKYKCLYFNMEMSEQQVVKRLVSINSRVPMSKLIISDTEYQQSLVKEGIKALAKKKIKIITGIQTVNSIRQTIIQESKESHLVVFIDYVGLIAGYSNKSLYESTTKIVKELRQMSLNFDCTIIALAQVNRNAEKNSRPELQDLKDSGELEQSAVSAILLHQEKENDKNFTNEIEVTIAKNRNGRTGTLIFEYNKANQQFYERVKRGKL